MPAFPSNAGAGGWKTAIKMKALDQVSVRGVDNPKKKGKKTHNEITRDPF